TMSEDVAGNPFIPFGKLATTHFARLVVLDETADLEQRPLPALLVLISDFDGSVDRYLDALVDLAGSGLDKICAHCVDYPTDGALTRDARLAYLRAHSVPASAVYVNTIGRSVEQVRQEAQLREAIQGFLDRTPAATTGAPASVRAAIQRYVVSEESL